MRDEFAVVATPEPEGKSAPPPFRPPDGCAVPRDGRGDRGRPGSGNPTAWPTNASLGSRGSSRRRHAFATARKQPVLCVAHVTNQMGRIEGDFEKGVADGAEELLNVISQVARRWREPARR